jgi:hypothetical protein
LLLLAIIGIESNMSIRSVTELATAMAVGEILLSPTRTFAATVSSRSALGMIGTALILVVTIGMTGKHMC